jgi:hypothetical protein
VADRVGNCARIVVINLPKCVGEYDEQRFYRAFVILPTGGSNEFVKQIDFRTFIGERDT